jgi:hypothetical protein
VWVAYEIVIAVAVFAKTLSWFRPTFLGIRSRLESWVGLLLSAFSAALGLGWWLDAGFLAALIAFGLASALIVSAAVNAAYEAGSKKGHQLPSHETGNLLQEERGPPYRETSELNPGCTGVGNWCSDPGNRHFLSDKQ